MIKLNRFNENAKRTLRSTYQNQKVEGETCYLAVELVDGNIEKITAYKTEESAENYFINKINAELGEEFIDFNEAVDFWDEHNSSDITLTIHSVILNEIDVELPDFLKRKKDAKKFGL